MLLTEAEKARSEAVDNAATLAAGLDQEQKYQQELEEALSDFIRRFGADGLEVGPTPRTRLSAVGGFLRSELRNAFRTGVRTCMAVFASHFQEITTPEVLTNVAHGFFFGLDDEEMDPAAKEATETAMTKGWYDSVEEAAVTLAARFEDEVCPPYSPISSTYEAETERRDVASEGTPTGPTPRQGDVVESTPAGDVVMGEAEAAP